MNAHPLLSRRLLFTVGVGFMLSLLLLIMLTVVGLRELSNTNNRLQHLVGEVSHKISLADQMRDILRDRALSMLAITIISDSFERDREVQQFYALGGEYQKARLALDTLIQRTEERQVLERLDALTRDNRPVMVRIVNLAMEGRQTEAFIALQNEELPRQKILVEMLDKLIAVQRTIERHAVDEADAAYLRTRNLMVGMGTIALLLAGLIATVVLRRTSRLAAETEKARTRYQTLFETNGDGIVILDQKGFIDCNPAALSLFGYTDRNALLSRQASELGTDPQPDGGSAATKATHAIDTAWKNGHAFLEWQGRRADGHEFPCEIVLHAMQLEGHPTLQAIIRDITPRKTAELALQNAHQAELAAAELKTQFVANVSHEIRTPLHGILGMSELFSSTLLNKEQLGFLTHIRESGKSLMRLLDDLLDFSKLRAGRMAIERIPFELVSELKLLCAPIQLQAQQKGLQFQLTIPTQSIWVQGDPLRLRQILTNLLDNALKFTPRGTITLSATLSAESWLFCVSDTGIGIPLESQTRIFDSFAQADGSVSRTYGGTGLGLAICRELVMRQNGRLWVESTPGQGSHFWVELSLPPTAPLIATADKIPAPDSNCHFTGQRILVAEDHPINQAVIAGMLRNLGLIPTVVGDGESALHYYQNEGADLILMDCHMPGWDGMTTTRAIRAMEAHAGWPRCPIVALTANAETSFAERCLQAGLDGCLSKPISEAELAEILPRWLSFSLSTPKTKPHEDMVELFITSTQDDLSRLATAMSARQLEQAAQLAHRIRGAASFMNAADISRSAQNLEAALREASPDMQNHLTELQNHFFAFSKDSQIPS